MYQVRNIVKNIKIWYKRIIMDTNISAMDIAAYYIKKSSLLAENDLTNLKLQKMLYYTQAEYAVANNGRTLFNEEIQAWQYGQ